MPQASVIVPIYNVAPYLPCCLDSLMAQEEGNLEFLLVNDGATDGSPEIIDAYTQKDSRFRRINRANGGLSAARNTGIEAARGDYLFFLDADDWAEPAWVRDALEVARDTGADQVLWNYRRVFQDHEEPAALPMKEEVLDLERLGLPRYFYRYWFPYLHGQEAWSRLYRRDLLLAHSLRFANGSEIFAEDTLMSAQLLLHTKRIAALAKPYIAYRQRPDGLMGAPKPRLARRLMELSRRYAAYAGAQGYGETLRNVLPMFCYRLITKGIRLDPEIQDVYDAMKDYRQDPLLSDQLRALIRGGALPSYLLHTGKGIRTQWRGRAFAARWLRGDYARAAALVEREV